MWPGHVEVLRAAARMEDRLGELALAESMYQQAVAANPQHAGARNDLGLCLARQGKLEDSVQAIEQAVQLQPEKPLYRNNAATVLIEMRQDQRALGHLAAVHGAAEANYNLGQLLVQRGRADEATPFFQAAVEQNPQMQSAHVALAKLQGKGAPASTATPTAPAAVPQQTPPPGPQFYHYPATARSPEPGASSYVPPTYYAPQGAAPGPYNRPATRYLPPVASQPGPVQR
jgi:Flp pilus assembly protein TadD